MKTPVHWCQTYREANSWISWHRTVGKTYYIEKYSNGYLIVAE